MSVWLESWPLSPLTVSTLSGESHIKELKRGENGFHLKTRVETFLSAGEQITKPTNSFHFIEFHLPLTYTLIITRKGWVFLSECVL